MITAEQIRAARGLLNWNQLDLASHCHLSKTVINNVERKLVTPRLQTLITIQNKLEEKGIEFIGTLGVNMKQDENKITIYEGSDSYARHLDDIIRTSTESRLPIYRFNISDKFLLTITSPHDLTTYYQHLKKHGLTEHNLVEEGNTTRFGPYETSSYRWIPTDLQSQNSYTLHGNTYSIFNFGENNRVINIESAVVANIFRHQFEAVWTTCRPQPQVTPLFDKYEREKQQAI